MAKSGNICFFVFVGIFCSLRCYHRLFVCLFLQMAPLVQIPKFRSSSLIPNLSSSLHFQKCTELIHGTTLLTLQKNILGVYHTPGTVLPTLHTSSHLIIVTTPQGSGYQLHFPDQKTLTQRRSRIHPTLYNIKGAS